MLHALVACCSLAASPAERSVPTDVTTAYRAASDAAGRSADAHVKVALWCEANGLDAERAEHLTRAVAIEPDHTAARGLLGQVERDGRWRSPEAVVERDATDAERAALLAEYHARRAAAPARQQAQWELALWCEKRGLKAEAAAHFSAVTRLEPGRPIDHRVEAWRRLGHRLYRGRWLTDDQVAAERAEAKLQEKADRLWTPRLADLRGRLDRPNQRAEAEAEMAAVTDPLAAPSVWAAFGKGKAPDQARAVQVLGQIDAPAASKALALLAVSGETTEVRRAAAETLARRDPRESVEWLIGLVTPRLKYEVRPPDKPGVLGLLRVEGERFIEHRRYTTTAAFVPGANFFGRIWTAEDGLPAAVSGASLLDYRREPSVVNARRIEEEIRRNRDRLAQSNAAPYGTSASMRLLDDIRAIESFNSEARAANLRRVLPVLEAVTGRAFGEDKEAWKKWWVDRQGYRYVSPSRPRVVQTEVVSAGTPVAITSCFGAGTPVATLSGLRPIEALQVGDQVLSRDGKTGALSYQPVVAVHRNPPDSTLRVALGAEEIVATGYHRFWKVGAGWVMARDLKAGDAIRTRDGSLRVSAIEPAPSQPVYNLDVANTRSFFVGRGGAFVHDNTPPSPETEPFDAAPELAAVGGPIASPAASAR